VESWEIVEGGKQSRGGSGVRFILEVGQQILEKQGSLKL
jgi:hypothetical protein